MEETKGEKLAREIRAKCNNHTKEQGISSYNQSIDIIFKNKLPHEWWDEITEVKWKNELLEKENIILINENAQFKQKLDELLDIKEY